jgi:hypothetical protein
MRIKPGREPSGDQSCLIADLTIAKKLGLAVTARFDAH